MENFRSKSCKDVRNSSNMQIESYNDRNKSSSLPPNGMHGLRSYSTSYAYSEPSFVTNTNELKMKKSKKGDFGSKSMKSWSFIDPELQRKRRVAGYKVYAVEGQLKGSFRKSFRWIKDRYSQVVYGWT